MIAIKGVIFLLGALVAVVFGVAPWVAPQVRNSLLKTSGIFVTSTRQGKT